MSQLKRRQFQYIRKAIPYLPLKSVITTTDNFKKKVTKLILA